MHTEYYKHRSIKNNKLLFGLHGSVSMPAFGNLLLAAPNLDASPVKEKMPRLGRVADGDAMFRGYRCGYRADDVCDERSGFQIVLAQFRRHVPRHEQQSHYLFVCWNCACQFFNGDGV